MLTLPDWWNSSKNNLNSNRCWLRPRRKSVRSKLELFQKICSSNWIEKSTISISYFLKILIPYSRFSRFDKTELKDCSARVFSNNFNFWDFESPKNSMPQKDYAFSSAIISSNWVHPESRIIVSGVMDISTSTKSHKHGAILDFWKVRVENY